MKKVILFLIASAFAISCSSDDNKSSNSISPIVGTWKPISEIHEDTRPGGDTTNAYESCNDKSRIVYSENKTANATIFYGNDLNNCQSYQVNNVGWNISNGVITYTYTNGETSTSNISFSNNNNTLTEKSQDGPVTITIVYSRIN